MYCTVIHHERSASGGGSVAGKQFSGKVIAVPMLEVADCCWSHTVGIGQRSVIDQKPC